MFPLLTERFSDRTYAKKRDPRVIADLFFLGLSLPACQVISNGAINLSPSKSLALAEAFPILNAGGRLQIADMVREDGPCQKDNTDQSDWAGCVAGTMLPEGFLKLIQEAGFVEVALVGPTGYRTSSITIGAHIRARKA